MPTTQQLSDKLDNLVTLVGTITTDITDVAQLLKDAQANGANIPQEIMDKVDGITSSLSAADASLKSAETPTS